MLFDKGVGEPPSPADATEPTGGKPRLRVPHRSQVEMHFAALDEMLDPDHQARVVWQMVCELDLSAWLRNVKAVEGHVGRSQTDPRLLLALWVYATLDGVGSARRIDQLCKDHLAYQWLCGKVTVNHHMLSDFRSQNLGTWDDLLTQIVGSLLAEDLVTMKRVAQDGMRVRANAGKASFRRRGRLEQALQDARQQVEALQSSDEETAEELSARQKAARERAARERAQRVQDALKHCEEVQTQRDARAKIAGQPAKEARASTSDPEARVMQFSDGGYRPGYNVQYATDVETGVIVGVDVTNAGNDSEQLPPMLDQLEERYEHVPEEVLIDGGFATKDAINAAADKGSTVYAPLKDEAKQVDAGKDPYAKKRGDSSAIAAWRARMGTAAAKKIYRLRAQSAEWVNAQARNRGFQQMPVRGRPRCRVVALLYAITHNLMQTVKLRAEASPVSA